MIPGYKVPYGLGQDETTERVNRAMDDMYSKVGGVWTFKKDFDYYALQKTNPIQITSTEWEEVSFYNTEIETPDLSALIINLNIPSSYPTARVKIRLNIDEQIICCFLRTGGLPGGPGTIPLTLNGLAVNIKKGKHIIKIFAITSTGGTILFLPNIDIDGIEMTKAPYVFANLWCVGFK